MKLLALLLLASPLASANQINSAVLVKPNSPVLIIPNPDLVKPDKFDMFQHPAWLAMVKGVKGYESYRSRPYICSGGKKTIGYGHTGKHVGKAYVSQREAEVILINELKEACDLVMDEVDVPLTMPQLAALTSFTFNCGRGSLHNLINQNDRLNSGNYESVNHVLPKYRMASGKVLRGLERRRAWELSLWNNSVEQ